MLCVVEWENQKVLPINTDTKFGENWEAWLCASAPKVKNKVIKTKFCLSPKVALKTTSENNEFINNNDMKQALEL